MSYRSDRRANKSSRSSRPGDRRSSNDRNSPDRRSRRKGESSFEQTSGAYGKKRESWKDDQERFDRNTGERRRFRGVPQENKYGRMSGGSVKQNSKSSRFPRRENSKGSFSRQKDRRVEDSSFARENSHVKQSPSRSYFSAGRDELAPKNSNEYTSEPASTDILWGRHSTKAALESGRPVHRIWCTPELRSSHSFLQLLRDAKSSGVLVEEVTWARLGQLTNGAIHQGIAIQTAAAETLQLKSLIEACSKLEEPPLLLALDGLTDPQNLGAIVRSAEAFGAHGLVLPQRRSAGLTGSVAKVAAGALEHLPVARVINLNRSLEALKDSGYTVVGLAEEGNKTLPEVDLEGPLVVVTGSEGKGISLVTRRHCDYLVRIPLRGVTPSLNASAATAVFLYEVARKGWMKGLSGQAPSPRMIRAKFATTSIENNDSEIDIDARPSELVNIKEENPQIEISSAGEENDKTTSTQLLSDASKDLFKESVQL